MKEIILDVDKLTTVFKNKDRELKILKDVSFKLEKGKILGIVGESGCGKSVTVNSIINLLPKNANIKNGSIKYFDNGSVIELNKLKQYGPEFRNLRGTKISMIFQDPMSALNPVYTIGDQIIEVLREHSNISKKDALIKAIEMLEKLGIKDAKNRINDYPHQFSGGQRQRIIIAIAMICNPDILIADEPTTALDVTIQAQILDLLNDLKNEYKTAIILITHDLGVISQIADEVAVMYAGEIVEIASVDKLFSNPLHPYTRSLLNSIPSKDNKGKKLHVIKGSVPSIFEIPEKGCRFKNRIPHIDDTEHESDPKDLHEVEKDHYVRCTCYKNFKFEEKEVKEFKTKTIGETILEVKNLKKYYEPKKRLFQENRNKIKALDNVSFELKKGMTIGIIGESGCGKSTLAKSLMKLHTITSGEININLNGFTNIYDLKNEKEMEFRKKVQMVFQDPYSSLNPKKKIIESFDEPMRVHNMGNKQERMKIIEKVLEMVNLPVEYLDRYPHEFSGGQRQRICIARALCLNPEILILDEPVSALDLSVQAQVLNYLLEIQLKNNLSYIFISHDLGVVKYMCDYIYIIHNGRFVEAGTIDDIFNNPKHIYTKRLLSAIPDVDISMRSKLLEKRKEIEKMYRDEYYKYYKKNGEINDLIQISDTHYVAIDKEYINDL